MKGVYLKGLDRNGKERWYFQVSYRGRPIHRRGGSEAAAIRKRELAQDRIDRGLPPFGQERKAPLTAGKAADTYLEASKANRSYRRARIYAKHINRLMPTLTLEHLSEVTLRRYRETRKSEGASDATVNREVSFLATANRYCKSEGLTDCCFFETLDRTKRRRVFAKERPGREFRRTSDEEFEEVFTRLPVAYRAPARLALLTGMRESESFGLRWSEVHGKEIRLSARTKGARARTIPLSPEAVALIPKKPEGAADADPVFRGPDGGNILPTLGRAWRAAREEAELPHLWIHDTRHEWASRFLEHGGTLVELMTVGGWGSLALVQRYARAEKDRIRRTMESMAAAPRVAVVLPEKSARDRNLA